MNKDRGLSLFILHPSSFLLVDAPCCSSKARYHASARAARSGKARVPQINDNVRRVSAPVLVRCVALSIPEGLAPVKVPSLRGPAREASARGQGGAGRACFCSVARTP